MGFRRERRGGGQVGRGFGWFTTRMYLPLTRVSFFSDYWLIYGLFLGGGRTEYDDVGAADRT
jgi:hypothetical protein